MKRTLRIDSRDNVIVALAPLLAGEEIDVDGVKISIKEDVAAGHKVALHPLEMGDEVIKYGYPIGIVKCRVDCGEWVHSHNLKSALNDNLEYQYEPNKVEITCDVECPTFMGYERESGDVGIRNELWIVPTVGCISGQGAAIVERLKRECDTSHLDDVRLFGHNYGCSQLGDDHQNTVDSLCSLIKHPNAGAVLVLGLGCENNQISGVKAALGQYDRERVKFLVAQEVEDEIETGFEICLELLSLTRMDRRSEQPLSKLKIGLKCGGSDGFSGITANPLLGRLSDWIVSIGGTTILTEVPEMFGAESILMNRAADISVFDSTVSLINDFKGYFRSFNQPIYENPSPGNKAGGITTLEEKSLGCVQKGGSATVIDVLKYAQRSVKSGLNLLQAPGNDLVASSALAFSGCQIVLFTTGRGTPFGSFVPTMKISTNSDLYRHKRRWIDFDAGTLLSGDSMDSLLEQFIDKLLTTANGEYLNHEKIGFKEIAIFKSGVTL